MIMKFAVLLVAAAVLAVNCRAGKREEALHQDLLNELNVLLEETELENELRHLLNEKADETDKRIFFPPTKQNEECSSENCINGDCHQGRTRSFCVCDNGWSGDRCDVEGKYLGRCRYSNGLDIDPLSRVYGLDEGVPLAIFFSYYGPG